MKAEEFLNLMNFPKKWQELEMYPDTLSEIQISGYKPGNECASEHDRAGAFHWWLKQEPTEEQLIKLMKLAYLDPEPLMGEDIKGYIEKSKNYSEAVKKAWSL